MVEGLGNNALTDKDGPGLYPQCNEGAAVAPGVNDDSTAGYRVLSIWADTTAGDAYICLDATAGVAVWKKMTP